MQNNVREPLLDGYGSAEYSNKDVQSPGSRDTGRQSQDRQYNQSRG